MRVREQLLGAALLLGATYFGILRIAEAKCDEAVGSRVLPLDRTQPEDLLAFGRFQEELNRLGQAALARRLEDLRERKELWIAPELGSGRWAAYVEALGLARRIYIRQVALLNPRAHLYPHGAADVPFGHQDAFALVSLGGAMRHELAHYDGAIEESDAYRQELAWYEELRASPLIVAREGEERRRFDWALESAMASARKAAASVGAAN